MSIYEVMEHELHGSNGTSLKGLVHTSLQRRSETSIALHFHKTDVVTAYKDGTVMLDDGGIHQGWNGPVECSVTTKKRIALYLPQGWNIYQSKNVWHIQASDGIEYDYERYMILHPENDTVEYKSGILA